jgi:two-component system response regulator YesN
MIKTLIVDDEKLVRKGLISTMPWEKFDIRIIGEANNGKMAIDFMQLNEVDLLITDLTMPLMSGFELMKIVRTRFPEIYIVVLTCHQDFDYLQETMRLGAIDYIVKTQLEQESMEEVLSRIVNRIGYEQSGWISRTSSAKPESAILLCESGLVYVSIHAIPDQKMNLSSEGHSEWIEIGSGMWFVPWGDTIDFQEGLLPFAVFGSEWMLIKVHELRGVSIMILAAALKRHIPKYVFFEYRSEGKPYELLFSSITRPENIHADQEWRLLIGEWLSLHWIYDDVAFDKLCKTTVGLKPTKEQLSQAIAAAVGQMKSICSHEKLDRFLFDMPSLEFWYLYVYSLSDIRNVLQQQMQRFPYSHEIVISLVKALNFIHQTEDFSFSRNDVAEKFNMSSGYFSECFKEIVGKSYGIYLKEQQIHKAKKLIRQTKHPIYWIAEQTGFKDEKYFSKMFREHVGLNPMEYRKKVERSADDT